MRAGDKVQAIVLKCRKRLLRSLALRRWKFGRWLRIETVSPAPNYRALVNHGAGPSCGVRPYLIFFSL